jgi:tetratricopeptide (TPR) repeat protein
MTRIEADTPLRPAAAHARRRWVLVASMIGMLGTASLAAQRTANLPPPPWPAELAEAFELYYAGEFLEVQRVCWQLRADAHDTRLRREAAALAALATMRLPSRTDRLSGRAQLAQLAEEDPSLLTRPECQLAYGIAQTALSETASALHHLDQAAKTFAERRQSDRLGETCVALAEAWARHGEWELTVPGMEIPRPANRADADRIRGERIRALRDRVAALPEREAYLPRIDLVLARHLMETEDGAAEGLALLEKLVGQAETTRATAQACLVLAERYEAAGRWTDAARLYARVQAASLGKPSYEAEQRLNAIQRPQLTLDVPGHVTVGQRVAINLRARNLATVEFEVRRIDLASWLEQRQGRFTEAALPTSGALVAARDLDTAVATEHDWWRSETLDEPLTFEAPAGAAVALARAVDNTGRTVTAKRLVLGGDLRAAVFIGKQQAAIWAIRGEKLTTAASEPELQARFWMHGSFVPTRPELTEGVGVFALPPEARLLRDKRWVCLVQAGEQVALCHGALPAEANRQGQPAVALIGGPPEPRVGDQLHVFGVLLGAANEQATEQPTRAVELELLDTLDRVHTTTTAVVSTGGAFSTRFPISAAMASQQLRVAARVDGQVLENVFSELRVRVARADAAPFRVECNLPSWLPPSQKRVAGQIEAVYPWGAPVSGASIEARFRAVRLPTTQPRRELAQSDLITRSFRLGEDGKCDFAQPLADFHLPDGPLALGLSLDVAGWDDRHGQGVAEVLVGPEPVHLWLRCDTAKPQVGQPLQFSVGWFDPARRVGETLPAVAVHRDGAPLIELEPVPATDGSHSATWRPMVPGTYEVVAALPQAERQPVTVRDTIEVAGRSGGGERDLPPLRYDARFTEHEGQPHVRVRLNGQRPHPLLVLLEAGDPLGAQQLPSLSGATELLLPLASQPRGATHLVLAAPGPDGVEILGVTEVGPADEDSLTLTVSADPTAAMPGAAVEVTVSCRRTSQPVRDAMLMARLIDPSRSSTMQWLPGRGPPKPPLMPGGIHIVSSAVADPAVDMPDASPGVIPETRQLSAQLANALFDGSTLWVGSQASADGATTFSVPLPLEPGSYQLVVLAQTADGAIASETLTLDTRRGIQLIADVPEQLTLGDRSVASLIITNREPAAMRVQVAVDSGPGLHVDELRPLDRQTRLEPPEHGTSFALTVAPRSSAILRASIEAAQVGPGTAVFSAQTERTRHRTAASYMIHAYPLTDTESQVVSGVTVAVRRTLFLLDKQVAAADEALGEGRLERREQTAWQRSEVAPDARLPPGQLLLVREVLSLEQPLAQVEWQQRLPGNCYTHAGEWRDLQQIGTLRELRPNAFTRNTAWLAAGQEHTQEYVIVAVRPGACQFPPPAIRAGGVPVRVEVKPAAQRVFVIDAE